MKRLLIAAMLVAAPLSAQTAIERDTTIYTATRIRTSARTGNIISISVTKLTALPRRVDTVTVTHSDTIPLLVYRTWVPLVWIDSVRFVLKEGADVPVPRAFAIPLRIETRVDTFAITRTQVDTVVRVDTIVRVDTVKVPCPTSNMPELPRIYIDTKMPPTPGTIIKVP